MFNSIKILLVQVETIMIVLCAVYLSRDGPRLLSQKLNHSHLKRLLNVEREELFLCNQVSAQAENGSLKTGADRL